jgi:hypothetical protein
VLVSPDYRVTLADQNPVAAQPQLEAVFVGLAADGDSTAAVEAIAAASALGYGAADDPSLTGRPLAFSSAASFSAVFPTDVSWLSHAVTDYFNAGGRRGWVVRIAADPATLLDDFVSLAPPIAGSLPESGVGIALAVPSAGLLVLPDLEQLCLEGSLPPPSPPAPPPAAPGFRPATDFVAPPRPAVAPLPPGFGVIDPFILLTRVSAVLASRPDMLCLFALPIGADQSQSVPRLVQRANAYLHGGTLQGPDLPQVQAFAPLLRDAGGVIATPSGLVAGFLAATAETDGVWRSIAGRTLPLGTTPLRRIESNALDELRAMGVAPLRFAAAGTTLDDDILAVRRAPPSNAPRRAAGTRRLMGWLLRNLGSFGEQLVFENVLDDGRVELMLSDLFDELLKRGALNGRQLDEAVMIRRSNPAPNAVQFDIGINTAVPVETIALSFLDGSVTAAFGAAP